jgi:hypothetical protein
MPLKLKEQYVEQIKADVALQGAIAKATGKNIQAPLQWANGEKHEKLTMLATLQAIAAYNKIADKMDLIEAISEPKAA